MKNFKTKCLTILSCGLLALSAVAKDNKEVKGIKDPPKEELRLLNISPLTGDLKATGTVMSQTIKAYVDEVQKNHEVPFSINLKTVDDGYVADKTLEIAQNEIKTFKPQALIGVVGSANVNTLNEKKFFDNGIPLIGARTGAGIYNPMIVHLRNSYKNEVFKLLELASIQGFTNVGVVYQNDAFGLDGFNAAKEYFAANPNMHMVASASYTRNTIEVSPAVKSMMEVNPSAVIIVGASKAVSQTILEMKNAHSKARFFTVSFTDVNEVVSLIKDNAKGLVVAQAVPSLYDTRFVLASDFKKFADRNHLSTNSTSFEAYIMARVTIEAAKRVKGPLTPQSLLAEIRSKPIEVGGMRFNLPDNIRPVDFVDTLIVGSGNQLFY